MASVYKSFILSLEIKVSNCERKYNVHLPLYDFNLFKVYLFYQIKFNMKGKI